MGRRAAREAALRALFQIDVGRSSAQRALEYNLEEMQIPEKDRPFVTALVKGTVERLEELDGIIQRFAERWSVDRMARTDRNILRLAIYEILYVDDIPPSVSVNEAVELAKEYGDADSPRFVNGILGSVVRSLAGVPETSRDGDEQA